MDSCAKELSHHRRDKVRVCIDRVALPDTTDVHRLTELTELTRNLGTGSGPSARNMPICLAARIAPECSAVHPVQADLLVTKVAQ